MKTALLLLCAVLIGPAAVRGDGPQEYGKKLTLKEPTAISSILSDPEAYKGKRVLVEGTVTDVCKHRGCWILLSGAKDTESIRFKVEDGVIEFSEDVPGKKARAEGIVSVRTLSVAQQIAAGQHHAQEQGTEFDSLSVKGPKTFVQIEGEGAILR